MHSVTTDFFKTQSGNFSDLFELAEDGVWYAKGHEDFAFLEDDGTDWSNIEEKSFWYRHRARLFAEVIKQYQPTGSIYEIGAGNGAVSMALQNEGYDIVAIEPTVQWAVTAKHRGVKNVICSKIENAGFEDGQFSNVGIFDVLEHIPNDAEFLAYIRKLMPVGGRMYCAVPAYKVLWSNEDDYAGHYRRYSLKDLSRKLENAGFVLEYKTYFFRPLIVPIFLLRSIPSLWGLRGQRTSASSERDHCPSEGIISKLLNKLLDDEFLGVVNGGGYKFGASCLVVARAC